MAPRNSDVTHIDEISRAIAKRLGAISSDCEIKFVTDFLDTDEITAKRATIELSFRSIAAEKPDRAIRDKIDTYLLRYELRVRGPEPLESQRIFSKICFSGADNGDFSIAIPTVGDAAQMEAGGTPRLSLTARLTPRPAATRTPIVTSPLGVEIRELGAIRGKVVSESGTPVMSAELHALALDKRVQTDAKGRFVLSGAPVAGAISMTVTARGKSINFSVDTAKQSDVVIVMPMEESHA